MIPDPYGRLFDGDDTQTPVPGPPVRPWPWPNASKPTITTLHCPGQYALTRNLDRPSDDDLNLDDGHPSRRTVWSPRP